MLGLCSGVLYSKNFYFSVFFSSISRSCFFMDESKNEYRTFGVVYVIIGIFFFFYFSFAFTDIQLLGSVWRFFPLESYFLVSFLFMFTFFGSLALVVFGFILVVSDVVWVARVSGVLFVILLGCFLLVLYYPIIIIFVQA